MFLVGLKSEVEYNQNKKNENNLKSKGYTAHHASGKLSYLEFLYGELWKATGKINLEHGVE